MNSAAAQKLPLRDVHLPPEPGLWPLAPGWWLLGLVVLGLFIWFAVRWYHYHQRKKRWLEMRQMWLKTQQDHQNHSNDTRLAQDLSNLLRRFVRHRLKDDKAASLSGDAWTDYLNHGLKQPIFNDFKDTLNTGLYQPNHKFNSQALLQAVHQFLQHHCLHGSRRRS